MKQLSSVTYFVATLGPVGSWTEGGPVSGGLGLLLMWFLPLLSLWLGGISILGLELLVMGAVILLLQVALKDERVVWYGDVPVAPNIVLDWLLGAMVCVHAAPRIPLVYAVAFLLYLLFNTIRPFGIRQARVLPRVWGIIADDLAAGALTHILLSLLSPLFEYVM